jgi:hypothetical protein
VNKYVLLATVKDRLHLMPTILGSVARWLPGWRVVIVTQAYAPEDTLAVQRLLANAVQLSLPDRVGPHTAKAAGLRAVQAHERAYGDPKRFVVCSVDDDMEFTARTKLDPAVQFCLHPATGFVSAGWVKHENQLAEKEAPDEFVKQPIVYTGGGLVFDQKMAELVLALPDGNYFCDNSEWSLAAYRAGFDNYRFRGSVSVHRICGKGGRRAWVALEKRPVPDPKYLAMKPARTGGPNAYHVGMSADLTAFAHAEHAANRSKLLGET